MKILERYEGIDNQSQVHVQAGKEAKLKTRHVVDCSISYHRLETEDNRETRPRGHCCCRRLCP